MGHGMYKADIRRDLLGGSLQSDRWWGTCSLMDLFFGSVGKYTCSPCTVATICAERSWISQQVGHVAKVLQERIRKVPSHYLVFLEVSLKWSREH